MSMEDMDVMHCPVCKGMGTIRNPETDVAEKCGNPGCEHGMIRIHAPSRREQQVAVYTVCRLQSGGTDVE
jgi:hypothetical protein